MQRDEEHFVRHSRSLASSAIGIRSFWFPKLGSQDYNTLQQEDKVELVGCGYLTQELMATATDVSN